MFLLIKKEIQLELIYIEVIENSQFLLMCIRQYGAFQSVCWVTYFRSLKILQSVATKPSEQTDSLKVLFLVTEEIIH